MHPRRVFASFVTSGRHVIAVYCFMFAGGVASDRWPPSGSIRGMDILKPHATHPFGVRAVRLTHFVPSGDVLASGQPASLRSLGTSWQAPSQLSGFSGLSELSGFFQVFRSSWAVVVFWVCFNRVNCFTKQKNIVSLHSKSLKYPKNLQYEHLRT